MIKIIKITFLLAVLTLLNLAKASEVIEEEGVLVLTDENFYSVINSHENVLVEFYAPWCGHCKELAPEYAKAAQTLSKETPRLYLAKVDATIHKKISERFNIEGFPTLMFFSNGKESEYTGGRNESEIVGWMKKKTGPASRLLTTPEEVQSFKSSSDVAVVLFSTEDTIVKQYENVSRSFDDIIFAHCGNPACLESFQVQSGAVILFKKFDEGRSDLAQFDEVALRKLITSNGLPLLMRFDEKSADFIFGKSVPGLFLYRDRSSEKSFEYESIMKSAAKKLRGRIQFVITDIKEDLESRLAEYIGVSASDLPTIRIHDTRTDLRKFTMDGEITEENILNFVDDWENGKLKPTLKSEEIPAEQNDDVYVLVGKSFVDVVMDSSKDVLVEFYAPWCGHCKELAPIYQELAKKLKHNRNLIIAKIDSTLNEVDQVSIQGFPTVKFFPANNKSNPLDYEGDRSVEGFIQFLTQHASNSIKEKEEL